MAPEMNKQFAAMPTKKNMNEFDPLEDFISDCNDLNSYINKIDALIENRYIPN